MKHYKYSMAVLGALASSVVVFHGAYGALTGSVTIQGMVPETCEITVTPDTSGRTIDDISVETTNHLVATVTETCNRGLGYRVVMGGVRSGSHRGLFVEPTYTANGVTAQHEFTVHYNGDEVTSGGEVTNVNLPVSEASKEVRISFTDNPTLPSTSGHTYDETLVFTMYPK